MGTASRQATVKSRTSKAVSRTKATMLQEEIKSLRAQVAAEISKQHASGVSLHLGDIDEEYVPDLKTLRNRTRIFERMANDPQVRGQLRAITQTIVSSVRWKVEGGSPAQRELVAANLLRQGPRRFWCSSSWVDFLYEAMGCLIYGFSLFGKTRAVVDGKVVFSDLSWLHPRSVDEDGWVMDSADNLLGVRRSYQDATAGQHTREFLPVDDLFLLTWDRRGPNWEGNAFIRPMYKPWLLGEMAEKIDIIDLQNRGVGIPVAHLSGTGGTKERNTLVEILRSMRGGDKSRAFIALDKDETVEYLTSQGTVKDSIPTLLHHRSNIVKSGGTEYFEQGNTATGSRAGASALATGFFINVDGIRVHLEDMINFGIGRMRGLAEELQDMNFDGIEDYAYICGSRVSPTEQLDNIPLVQDSVAKGLVPPHRKLANETLRRLGWPELSQAEYEEAIAQGKMSPALGGPGRPNEAGPDDEGRDDREGRRYGADSRVSAKEKKTSKRTLTGEIQRSQNRASWPWLRSQAG